MSNRAACNIYSFKNASGEIIRVHSDRAKAQKLVDGAFGKGLYSVYRTSLGKEKLKDYLKRVAWYG